MLQNCNNDHTAAVVNNSLYQQTDTAMNYQKYWGGMLLTKKHCVNMWHLMCFWTTPVRCTNYIKTVWRLTIPLGNGWMKMCWFQKHQQSSMKNPDYFRSTWTTLETSETGSFLYWSLYPSKINTGNVRYLNQGLSKLLATTVTQPSAMLCNDVSCCAAAAGNQMSICGSWPQN